MQTTLIITNGEYNCTFLPEANSSKQITHSCPINVELGVSL